MNRLPAVLFALALAVALVLLTPLRAATGWLGLDRAGLSAERVSGVVWSGRLESAGFRGVPLGQAAVRLDPFGLLTGVQRLRVEARDGMATGSAVLVRSGGQVGVTEAAGTAPLALTLAGRPIRGAVTVRDLAVTFEGGRCVRASGQVSADLLQRNGALVGQAGGLLTGRAACSGGALVVPLRGASASANVELRLRIEADGRYRMDTRIVTGDPALSAGLALAGFVADGDARGRTDEGRLWR